VLKLISHGGKTAQIGTTAEGMPESVIWVDLLNPTNEEVTWTEENCGVRVPSRDDLSEIELSSRLAREGNSIYLSSPVIGKATIEHADMTPAGFIVAPQVLVTVRFEALPTFDIVAERLKHDKTLNTGMAVFIALMEAAVDRGADVLEHLAAAVDEVSRAVFRGNLRGSASSRTSDFTLRHALSKLGSLADRSSKARDVLLGIGRMATFTLDMCRDQLPDGFHDQLHAVSKDISSLSDYESHLSDKAQFLLDAVLGFITIEQNDIFKVLTIASVVGVPPTLLAGIWGMNFKFMPELSWTFGYPLAWVVIIASGVVPLIWFWKRGWF
jgi:magnesium transporter